jgi:hypothetical protein
MPSNSTTDCGLDITLGLGANASVMAGQNETVYLSLSNDLPTARDVNYTDLPTLPHGLSASSPAWFDDLLPLQPSCGYPSMSGYEPVFMAVFNSTGAAMQLSDSPLAVLNCISTLGQNYHPFNASQTLTDSISIGGFWTGHDASEPWINATYTQFSPGSYTIVAFDPWGQMTELTFTVTNLSSVSVSLADPAQRSFQFVQAGIGNVGGSAVVNATFRSELATDSQVDVVGVAYPAETANPYGLPGQTVCCPLVQSYAQSAAAMASSKVEAGAQAEFSTNLLLPSSLNGTYLLEVYVTSSNGTLLSPISNVFMQITGGVAVGGQAGAASSFFDSDNGLLYVADSGVDALTVINGSTSRIVATISLPEIDGNLHFYLYDPGNRELYVGFDDSPVVYAVNTSSNFIVSKLVTSEPGQSLTSMVYDPLNGKIFGINFVYSEISVIDGSSNSLVANITGIQAPLSGFFDPKSNEVLVSAYNGTVFAINASTDKIVGMVPTSAGLFLYDPDNQLLYANSGQSIIALNASTFQQVGPSISLANSTGSYALYDSFNKDIYLYEGSAFNSAGGQLIAVSTESNSIVATIPVPGFNGGLVIEQPSFVYDSTNGNIYATELTNPQNGTVGLLAISPSNSILSQTFPSKMPLNYISLDEKSGLLYGDYGMGSSVIFSLNLASGAVTTIEVGTVQVYTLAP